MAAGSGDFVERFGRQSGLVKLATFLLVGAVLGGAYWYLFYDDMVIERDAALASKKKLVDEERSLLDRKTKYAALLERKKKALDDIAKNSVKLPETSELPAFFAHLETQASTANVKLLSRSLEKEVLVETYVKVPVKMSIEGDFYQINQYFKLLYETPRPISIDTLNIKVKAREADRTILGADFVASTFRQADQAPAPAPGAPAKADAKAPAVPVKARAEEAGKAAEIK
jgi:type IV pilus assembly protein PilO